MTRVKFIPKQSEVEVPQSLTYGDCIRVHSTQFPDHPMDFVLIQTGPSILSLLKIYKEGDREYPMTGHDFFNRYCEPANLRVFNLKWRDLNTANIADLFPDNLNSGKIEKVKYEITFKEL